MKYTFSRVMCQDTRELIGFKLVMMLNTIDSSLNDLDVHSRSQGHRKVGTCSHSVVKLHEATHMFVMVASVREMTLKKSCNYGEYGSFLHFLLFFVSVH